MLTRPSSRAAAFCGVVALALGTAPLAGQAADSPPLTAAGAMALARERHPALAGASARRRSSVGLARQQAAFPNPVVEWRQENLGSPLAPDVFLTLSQPLDITGRRLALRAEVRAVDARAVADSVTVARDVEAGAARAFWRVALARALLEVADAQRCDAERLAATETSRAREGAVAELTALRAGLEAERTRLTGTTAQAEWSRASAELARAVGVAPDSLPPVLPLGPAVALPASVVPSLDATVATALERRSDLVALRAGVDAARRRLTAERRASLPDVALLGGTKRTAGYTTHVIGVTAPLPLFDRNGGGREYAAGALLLAESELRAAEQAARAEVSAAVESLRALLAGAAPRADSLAAHASEVAQIADAAYLAGGGSLLELLDARRARAEALTAALRWAAEVHLARLELNRASGAPLLDSLETP